MDSRFQDHDLVGFHPTNPKGPWTKQMSTLDYAAGNRMVMWPGVCNSYVKA